MKEKKTKRFLDSHFIINFTENKEINKPKVLLFSCYFKSPKKIAIACKSDDANEPFYKLPFHQGGYYYLDLREKYQYAY